VTARQAIARAAFARLARHPALQGTRPVLAGTFPLELDVAASDLDIICEVRNPARFADRLARAFGHRPGFRLWLRNVDGLPTVVARFPEAGLPVEIFAQGRPAHAQRAVRHLRAEARLIKLHGEPLRRCVRARKTQGVKTEPAFASCLGLAGDPYLALLDLYRASDAALRLLSVQDHARRSRHRTRAHPRAADP